jgi:hypothetical protein
MAKPENDREYDPEALDLVGSMPLRFAITVVVVVGAAILIGCVLATW